MVSLRSISVVYPTEESNLLRLDRYPEIDLNCDTHVMGQSLFDPCRDLLVPVNEGILKRMTRTFFESGFLYALNEARDSQMTTASPLIHAIAQLTSRALAIIHRVKTKVFPYMRERDINSVAEHAQTRNWISSYIRCIDWHPNYFKIAVAGCDDIIRIFTEEPVVIPVLKNTNQKWITAMAWRPFSTGGLAVACQRGICLWTLDTALNITRTSLQMTFLQHPNNCTVNSIQWNPDGSLLASSSIGDSNVLVWDVDRMQNVPLMRVGPPCTQLCWSLDGASLFSATMGSVFRVWAMNKKCRPERWTITDGRIQSACWSPCGSFLLFVTSLDSILYRLQFTEKHAFTADANEKHVIPIADLSKCVLDNRETGGQPQSIAWDPSGCCLAITFRDTNLIAVIATCLHESMLTISPVCFLSGFEREYPSFICFQRKGRNKNHAVLTIGWSSGRVQYHPFAKGVMMTPQNS